MNPAPYEMYQNSRPVFDGKRMRKAIQRRTIDYGSPSVLSFERQVYQRDRRDHYAIQPASTYIPELLPPLDWEYNSASSFCSKFIRPAINKDRHPVNKVVWTPEGRRLITGITSGEFTLWNGLTFNFETMTQAHKTAVRSMIWSHDEDWMVSGSDDGEIKFWQSSMNNVKTFVAHHDVVRGLAFSPTDSKLASCSDDLTIKIWDFARCEMETELKKHLWEVKCIAWHPTMAMMASGSKDNQIIIWDPRAAECIDNLHDHKGTVVEVLFNGNGNWLLTASRDQSLKLFDVRTLKEIQHFRGHDGEVTSAAWHPIHERIFCSGGADGSILYWEVGQPDPVARVKHAHENNIWSLAWHPAGHILCSGGNDKMSKFWTRNRPGDSMDDKHNSTEVMKEDEEFIPHRNMAAPGVIPGMGYRPSEVMYSPY
uniref:Uncharacterized protein n=1 Tax=Vannella robusta TaxID=1487602 RepID=A0A7S4MMH6_9EUKA|mmetsp:Transcript_3362/g.4164  ORF Transcript_3362/g.4164 Transcript_3362/m.4164 type:complete len:425 (+) Transcript_3362:2-1276(+)